MQIELLRTTTRISRPRHRASFAVKYITNNNVLSRRTQIRYETITGINIDYRSFRLHDGAAAANHGRKYPLSLFAVFDLSRGHGAHKHALRDLDHGAIAEAPARSLCDGPVCSEKEQSA